MEKKDKSFRENQSEVPKEIPPSTLLEEPLSTLEMNILLLAVFSFVFSQILSSLLHFKYLLLLPVPISFILIVILLYNLLFPPRLSVRRVAFLLLGLILIWLSIHPTFY